jgi:hypothetical protein
MCSILVLLIVLVIVIDSSSGVRIDHEQEHDYEEEERNVTRNGSPRACRFSSSFAVQSQSQHAHGSVPFSCRQLRRECASFTVSSSKYFSQ